MVLDFGKQLKEAQAEQKALLKEINDRSRERDTTRDIAKMKSLSEEVHLLNKQAKKLRGRIERLQKHLQEEETNPQQSQTTMATAAI